MQNRQGKVRQGRCVAANCGEFLNRLMGYLCTSYFPLLMLDLRRLNDERNG